MKKSPVRSTLQNLRKHQNLFCNPYGSMPKLLDTQSYSAEVHSTDKWRTNTWRECFIFNITFYSTPDTRVECWVRPIKPSCETGSLHSRLQCVWDRLHSPLERLFMYTPAERFFPIHQAHMQVIINSWITDHHLWPGPSMVNFVRLPLNDWCEIECKSYFGVMTTVVPK